MDKRENIELKDYSNYKIGGPARWFIETETIEELLEAVKFAKDSGSAFYILGDGTNILWSDDGFDGVVIRPNFKGITYTGNKVEVGAGVPMRELVTSTASNGLAGLEWAGGLPGSVGGAIYGNAGCFGGEIKDSIEEVVSLNAETLELKRRSREECNFEYRDSIFKSGGGSEIIIGATFKLYSEDGAELRKSVQEKIDYRKERHPIEYPNIGSIFKNVPTKGLSDEFIEKHKVVIKEDPFPVIPTAYLIDKAGLKGGRVGDAVISSKHPNFIVNVGNAKASDVKKLIGIVKVKVKEQFGIDLQEEVRIIS